MPDEPLFPEVAELKTGGLLLARDSSDLPVGGVRTEFESGKDPKSLEFSLRSFKAFQKERGILLA